jgi:hypothetical protein
MLKRPYYSLHYGIIKVFAFMKNDAIRADLQEYARFSKVSGEMELELTPIPLL